jgi:hypothetical protein
MRILLQDGSATPSCWPAASSNDYLFQNAAERLFGTLTLAFEAGQDNGALDIEDDTMEGLISLLETRIQKKDRRLLLSLELCGIERDLNPSVQRVVETALRHCLPSSEQQQQLDKISISDPSWISVLRKYEDTCCFFSKIQCLAYQEDRWGQARYLDDFCRHLESNTGLESLQIRTWNYGTANFRTIQTLSWDRGLDRILQTLEGHPSLTSLTVDVLSWSTKKIEALDALLTHPECHVENLSLKCCPSAHQRYKLDYMLPSIVRMSYLKCLRLSTSGRVSAHCPWKLLSPHGNS